MVWTYLAASADSLSPWEPTSDQSPTVKSIPTVELSSYPECLKDSFLSDPSGTTYVASTAPISPQSISSTEASLARTSRLRALDAAWRESVQDWFARSSVSLKSSSQRSSSLKTFPLSALEAETWSSKSWPVSGMTVDGTVYALSMWARRTKETGGSYWPTATASDAKNSRRHGYMIGGNAGTTLLDFATLYPTLGVTTGSLNPHWVDWLMGYPTGWSACAPLATPSSPSKRKKRSSGSQD